MRRSIRSSLPLCLGLAFGTPPLLLLLPSLATPAYAIGAKSATLKDTLERGLRARRPVEFAFLERVVTMVDQNKLPVDLVRSTFDWARDKQPYPYPYFERALKLRAAQQGIIVQ